MQIICDTFNIILFVTAVGSVFTIVSLAADRILHFTPPLWFSICGMAAYVLPVLSPGLYLVPPEPHSWIQMCIRDSSHSPKYQNFKIDELPKVISLKQDWNWNCLLYTSKQRRRRSGTGGDKEIF